MKAFKIILMIFGGFFLTGTIVVVPIVIYKKVAKSFPDGVWDGTHLALNRGLSDELVVVCPAIYRLSKDGQVKITLENPAAQASGTWTYDGNVLSISIPDYGVLRYKVLEKTNDRVVWRVESAELNQDAIFKVLSARQIELLKTGYGDSWNIPDKVLVESGQRIKAELAQNQKLFESKMIGQSMTWKRVEDSEKRE